MPAQGFFFILYSFVSIIIFPFATINFLIINTPLLSNIRTYVVTTSSMEPKISVGSLIYTSSKQDYVKGDIITFRDSIGIVTHRIVEKISIGNEVYYKTKGDANKFYDNELIQKDEIYGKLESTIPLIGNGILALRSTNWIITGTVLPALFLIFGFYLVKKTFP